MAALAAAQFILTGFGLWFIYLTLQATRTTLRHAEIGMKASHHAARASREANAVLRSTAEAEMRPWLQMIPSKVMLSSDEGIHVRPGFTVTLQNLGKTPARNVAVRSLLLILTDEQVSLDDAMADRGRWMEFAFDTVFPGTPVEKGVTAYQKPFRKRAWTTITIWAIYEGAGGQKYELAQIFTLRPPDGAPYAQRWRAGFEPGEGRPAEPHCDKTLRMT